MKITLTFCAVVFSAWASLAWAAEPVAIPGTHMSLVPPDGFAPSKDFAGLQGDKASVLIVEIPAATFEPRVAAISAGAMAKQGVEITSGDDFTGLPSRARVYRGRQSHEGLQIDKWLLLIDTNPTFTMLNVSATRGAPLSHAQVLEMFKSVRIAAATAGDPVAALPFTITARPRFSYRQALFGSGLALGSAPPKPENASQPGLIVYRAVEQPVPRERWPQAFAALLQGMRAIKFDRGGTPSPTKVGDLEGLELKTSGTSDGAPSKALVVMLFTGRDAYSLIGMSSPELFDGAEWISE